jgi:hypothetical protein
MTAGRLIFVCAAMAWAFSPSLAAREPVMIDGIGRADWAETTSVMRCEGFRVEMRYREERFDPERTPSLDRALRVTLLGLTVSGRSISTAERAKVEALFQSFAWIDDTDLRCAGERIQINVVAMSKAEWIDYIEERGRESGERNRERPRAHARTIGVSPEGRVTIDGPGL